MEKVYLNEYEEETILEKALIDEVDMVLNCNFDDFETGLELSYKTKLQIARDIIDYEEQLWEDLHIIVMERVLKEFQKRRKYLERKEKISNLDKEELFELKNLKEYIKESEE